MTEATAKKPRLRDFLPGKFVTTPAEFNDAIERIEDSGLANLLCPVRLIDYIPPVMAVSFRVVPIPLDGWYAPSFCKNGELALKGESIALLWREAGGKVLPSTRTDDGTNPHVRTYQANVVLRAMNGRDLPTSKGRDLDLQPGAPEYEGMVDKSGKPLDRMRAQARMTIDRVCETKAQLRAIRAALGVRQMYSREESSLAFVIPTLVANPDMNNPLHANFMLAHATDTVDLLFGKRNSLPAHEPETIRVDARSGEIIEDAIDAEETQHVVEDFADLPAMHDCGCPCECKATVTEEVATLTMKKGGAIRCAECWPGKRFVYDRHKNLGSLGLNPDVTPKQAAK